jgi:hypothetical protein
MQRVTGTITAITADKLTVQDADGKNVDVKLTSDTQFRKDQQPAKASDFKVGDRIAAAGETSDGVLMARFVMSGMMRGGRGDTGGPAGMRGRGGMGGPGMNGAGLGTQFITGEVKKIDDTHLTILRPDGQTQIIDVDENTSFRNGKDDSVTLADIKVGDRVGGRGEMKNGVFVPSMLRVGIQMPPRPTQDNK